MTKYLLTDKLDLANDEAREFSIETAQGEVNLFVVKHQDEIYAYQNKCPHLGIPLNWQPDEFMSMDSEHIQCSTHGALFKPENGHCILGPCSGQKLTSLALEYTADNKVWLTFTQLNH